MSNRVRGRILSRTRDQAEKKPHQRQIRTFHRKMAESAAERALSAIDTAGFSNFDPDSTSSDRNWA